MTKTCMFTASFLDGLDGFGNNRLARNIKYIEYYRKLKEHLGHELMVFADNHSSTKSCNTLLEVGGKDIAIMRFDHHLERISTYSYPYLWRALYSMQEVITDFDKVIAVDSDCFVLTKRVADYIKGLNSGWTTFWCKKYGFPAAEIHILCKDTYSLFRSFIGQCRWEDRDGHSPMEIQLPFTHTEMSFNCDRWGEERLEQQASMDIYCQAQLETVLTFV